MRTGFHTNSFAWAGVNDLEKIAAFAADTGFDFLEVGPGIPLLYRHQQGAVSPRLRRM